MNAAYFQRMIDYTYWTNRKVWGCIEELSDDYTEMEKSPLMLCGGERSYSQG